MYFFTKLKKRIKDSILCIKYPFLYPRNRFDDKHHHSIDWLNTIEHKLSKKAYKKVYIHGVYLKEKSNKYLRNKIFIGNNIIYLSTIDRCIYVLDSKKRIIHTYGLPVNKEFNLLDGIYCTTVFRGDPLIEYYTTRKEYSDLNYGFPYHSFDLVKSNFYKNLYLLYKWINKNIFNKIFFIPSHTELDALEPGWRKAFGESICKEIKEALLKKGGRNLLHKYRIMQIKEKWGYLHWYDNWSFKDLDDIKHKYENLSELTCICCGKKATHMTTGWVSPYCDECDKKS